MSKVDIIRRHIGSDDFYDLNGTEMLSKILAAMDEYAQEQVKLFAIPDVSQQRELLLAFERYAAKCTNYEMQEGDYLMIEYFLKANNCG